jgi:hypothetical protein
MITRVFPDDQKRTLNRLKNPTVSLGGLGPNLICWPNAELSNSIARLIRGGSQANSVHVENIRAPVAGDLVLFAVSIADLDDKHVNSDHESANGNQQELKAKDWVEYQEPSHGTMLARFLGQSMKRLHINL